MEIYSGILGAILVLLMAMLVAVLRVLIHVLIKQNKIVEDNTQLGLKQVKAFEGTTTLPPNMASANCQHHWTIIKDEKLSNTAEQKMVVILQCEMCGSIDKTIEHIAPFKPDPPPTPKSECRHVWEKQKAVILESAYEQIAENTPRGSILPTQMQQMQNNPWFFRKRYISQRICPKCGAIDTIIASNYDIAGEDSSE